MLKLNNKQIDKYRNNPVVNKFVKTFVNMMLTYGYDDTDQKDIFKLCEYYHNREIKAIVKGLNDSHRLKWE